MGNRFKFVWDFIPFAFVDVHVIVVKIISTENVKLSGSSCECTAKSQISNHEITLGKFSHLDGFDKMYYKLENVFADIYLLMVIDCNNSAQMKRLLFVTTSLWIYMIVRFLVLYVALHTFTLIVCLLMCLWKPSRIVPTLRYLHS